MSAQGLHISLDTHLGVLTRTAASVPSGALHQQLVPWVICKMSTSDFALRSNEIRNCCNACAVAKVKCTKEKPFCRRCVRRGHACIYAVAMRQGRPRLIAQERRSDQDLLEIQTGSNRQQPISLHAARSFSDVNAGMILHHTTIPSFLQAPTNDQPSDNMDFLSPNNTETAHSSLDSLFDLGGANELLTDFAHFDPLLPAHTALYDDSMSSTKGCAVSENNDASSLQMHEDGALDSTPLISGNILGHETHGSAPVPISETLSTSYEPFGSFQIEYPPRSKTATNVPNLPTADNTANYRTCDCSAKVSSLLEQLTPHGVVGVTRASGNPLLCNLDAILLRNEGPLRKVNGVLQCSCSFGVSVLLHLAAVMLKILGWYTAIIGIMMRCASSFYAAPHHPRDTFPWLCELFEPCDAGIDGPEQAQEYLHLVSVKLGAMRPILSTLNFRLLTPGKRSAFNKPSLDHRLENTTRSLLRAGGLCGTLSCKSIAHAFDAELRSRFEGSWQLLVDALHSL